MIRSAVALLAALLLVACSAGGGEEGTATLWVTRDRGAEVLHETDVPAGVTVLQALEAEAEVETRYGGRFVHAIDGVAGSPAAGRDWFYFVNGYQADRGAAEYRLRDGDVIWWDYRGWRGRPERRVVVGAFPEPFLHGYDGRTRPAAVRYDAGAGEAARELAEHVGADSVEPASAPVPEGANLLRVVGGSRPLEARLGGDGSPGGPVEFVLGALEAARLARDPGLARFRFAGLRA